MGRERAARISGLRHLLVATDFSANAEAALNWATAIAVRDDARLTLVHARTAATTSSTSARETGRRLADLARRLLAVGLEVTCIHRAGRPWDVINETQHATDVDLVVIGSRGHSPYPDVPLGRTADRVLRTLNGSALIVHPDDAGGESSLGTVLAATDFSADATAAVALAARLATSAGGRLVLVHATVTPAVSGNGTAVAGQPPEVEADLRRARERLEAIAHPLRRLELVVEVVVSRGYAATVIEQAARDVGADLLVLGALGRSELDRPMLGSVVERVLHHASCPVLTVRGGPCRSDAPGRTSRQRITASPSRPVAG